MARRYRIGHYVLLIPISRDISLVLSSSLIGRYMICDKQRVFFCVSFLSPFSYLHAIPAARPAKKLSGHIVVLLFLIWQCLLVHRRAPFPPCHKCPLRMPWSILFSIQVQVIDATSVHRRRMSFLLAPTFRSSWYPLEIDTAVALSLYMRIMHRRSYFRTREYHIISLYTVVKARWA